MAEPTQNDARLDAVVEALVDDSTTGFKIDRATAQRLLEETLRQDRKLRLAVEKEGDIHRLRRTRAYRDARKQARKTIYYALRRYKGPTPSGVDLPTLTDRVKAATGNRELERVTEEILALHSSTRERLASRETFDEQLLAAVGRPRTVLDVGSGVYPLMSPFLDPARRGTDLELYVALDRDPEVIEAVRTFAVARPEPRLVAHRWELAEGWDTLAKLGGEKPVERFDVALLLKLVPVVARQEPGLLATTLAHTPAHLLVVSGSRTALTRRTDIERRERRGIERWIESHRFETVGELKVEEEFAYVLRLQASDR